MRDRTFTTLDVNGSQEEVSTTVAALLALEDAGLCIVKLAMSAEDPRKFVLSPGQAARAIAVGVRQRQLETGKKAEAVDVLRDRFLTAARQRAQGTSTMSLVGSGYIASIQSDMAESLEPSEAGGPKT